MTTIRTFLPPEAASIDPHGPYCEWINAEHLAEMDDMAGIELITTSPFKFTPAQRKAQDEFVEAMRAGELRRLPTVFGELV